MTLHSRAFRDGDVLPIEYTQDDLNYSPPLNWRRVPRNARSLVIVLTERDRGGSQVHWLLYNFLPFLDRIDENDVPGFVTEGLNYNGVTGYLGPYRVEGSLYVFSLYALRVELPRDSALTWDDAQKHMDGHILKVASLQAYFPLAMKGSRRQCLTH